MSTQPYIYNEKCINFARNMNYAHKNTSSFEGFIASNRAPMLHTLRKKSTTPSNKNNSIIIAIKQHTIIFHFKEECYLDITKKKHFVMSATKYLSSELLQGMTCKTRKMMKKEKNAKIVINL